jgi:hypothetical protein
MKITVVGGHQNLPSDGHEISAMAITESDQVRRSSCSQLAACRVWSHPERCHEAWRT